jgi:hypothetical protein
MAKEKINRAKKMSLLNKISEITAEMPKDDIFKNVRRFSNIDDESHDFVNEYRLLAESLKYSYKNLKKVGILFDTNLLLEYEYLIHEIYDTYIKEELISFYKYNGDDFISSNIVKILKIIRKIYSYETFLLYMAKKSDKYLIIELQILPKPHKTYELVPKTNLLSFDSTKQIKPSFSKYSNYIKEVLDLFNIDPSAFRRYWNDKVEFKKQEIDELFVSTRNYTDKTEIVSSKDLADMLMAKQYYIHSDVYDHIKYDTSYDKSIISIFCKISTENLLKNILERSHKIVVPKGSVVVVFNPYENKRYHRCLTKEEFYYNFKDIRVEKDLNPDPSVTQKYSFADIYFKPEFDGKFSWKETTEITKFISVYEYELQRDIKVGKQFLSI